MCKNTRFFILNYLIIKNFYVIIIIIMKKVRIVENKNPVTGMSSFTIQQKHFLFRWWWVDAWVNSMEGASCTDTFSTLEEAKKNLSYFDGTKFERNTVYEK